MSDTEYTTISRYFLRAGPAEEVEYKLDSIVTDTNSFPPIRLHFKMEREMQSLVFLRRNFGAAFNAYKTQVE